MLLELAGHCWSWLALGVGPRRSFPLESEQQEPGVCRSTSSLESEQEPRAAEACQHVDSGLEGAPANAEDADDEEVQEEEYEEDNEEDDEEEVCFLATKTARPEETHEDDGIEDLVGGAENCLPAPETADDALKSAAKGEASCAQADAASSKSPEECRPAVKRLESSFIDSSALEVLLGDIPCIICFESLRGKTLTVAMCGHIYHKACLDASPGDLCPQCRRPVDEPRQNEQDRRLQPSDSTEAMSQLLAGHLVLRETQRMARVQSQELRFVSDTTAALFSPRTSQVLAAAPELPSLGSPGVSGREPLPPWLNGPGQPQDSRPSRPISRAAALNPPWEPWQAGPLVSPSVSQAALPGREPMPPWLPPWEPPMPSPAALRSSRGPSSSRSASPRWVASSPRLPGHSRSPRLSTRPLAESQSGLLSHGETETVDAPSRSSPDQPPRFNRYSFSGAGGAYREPDAVEAGSVRLDHPSRSPRGLAPANRAFRELETIDGPVRIDQQIRSPHSFRAFREIETIHGIP